MWCSLDELRQKEVIDATTGEKLGYIDDIEFDSESKSVLGFRIYGRRLFFGLFKLEADLFIPCEWIRLYGKDIVLTDSSQVVDETYKNNKRTT